MRTFTRIPRRCWRLINLLGLALTLLSTACSGDGGGTTAAGGGTSADGGVDAVNATDAAPNDAKADGANADAHGTGASDSGTLDTAGLDSAAADGETSGGDAAAGPTFGKVWKEVFVVEGCNGAYCHAGVWPNEAAAYKQLLAAKSFDKACATAAHVTKGKPESSLLWLKMDPAANHGCGKKMPLGEAGVSAAASKLVKDWIVAGAPQ